MRSGQNISSSRVNIGHPRFLAGQSGPFEDQLKERLCLMFDRTGGVAKAYLLRVAYEGGFDRGVLLGLSADEKKMDSIAAQVGEIFAALFSRDQCLDIVLLDDDSEKDAAAVCTPFYARSSRGHVGS
jgi:hypothetical protein